MKINEAYNPHDRLIAKLKGVKVNFAIDENTVDDYCKYNHVKGNVRSKNLCEAAIDETIKEIDLLLNIEIEDDLLGLYQDSARIVKDRLLILRDSL